ncbi:alkaline phosphatase family protein [Nocardioides sp.]|uniref:alkaline phosphatase family protein n=1 Tax=Nocardioides sp. TaxID=35761 RepID=UPI0035653740
MRRRTGGSWVILLGLLSGCAVGSVEDASQPAGSTAAPSETASATPGESERDGPRVTKLLVFVVENHSFSSMRDRMPWTFAMSERYGYATNYDAVTHPSLPNYLAMVGGSDFEVDANLHPDDLRIEGESIFGQALDLGRTAVVYNEDMAENCQREDTPEGYAYRHNAWVYFVDERDACEEFSVSMAGFADDVAGGALPNAGMVVPNVCNDGHDCDLSVTDDWMQEQVGLAMSGPDWATGDLAIVITADEDDDDADNQVLTSVLHPSLEGVVTDEYLTHYSLARLYGEVLGAPLLREAVNAPSMARAFGLPVGAPER